MVRFLKIVSGVCFLVFVLSVCAIDSESIIPFVVSLLSALFGMTSYYILKTYYFEYLDEEF